MNKFRTVLSGAKGYIVAAIISEITTKDQKEKRIALYALFVVASIYNLYPKIAFFIERGYWHTSLSNILNFVLIVVISTVLGAACFVLFTILMLIIMTSYASIKLLFNKPLVSKVSKIDEAQNQIGILVNQTGWIMWFWLLLSAVIATFVYMIADTYITNIFASTHSTRALKAYEYWSQQDN